MTGTQIGQFVPIPQDPRQHGFPLLEVQAAGGSGTKAFDLKDSPDDSVNAGEEQTVYIQGKDGTQVKCNATHDYRWTIVWSDHLMIRSHCWTSEENTNLPFTKSNLEQSLVTLGRKETIDVTVTLPSEQVEQIDLSISPNGGGEAYDEVTLSVSVAAVHALTIPSMISSIDSTTLNQDKSICSAT